MLPRVPHSVRIPRPIFLCLLTLCGSVLGAAGQTSQPAPTAGAIMARVQVRATVAHAAFRSAALLKWSIERRKPSTLQLGDD